MVRKPDHELVRFLEGILEVTAKEWFSGWRPVSMPESGMPGRADKATTCHLPHAEAQFPAPQIDC